MHCTHGRRCIPHSDFDTWRNPHYFPPPAPPLPPLPPTTPQLGSITRLNSRFRRPLKGAAPLEAGVLIHQFDGYQDPLRPWSPCSPDRQDENHKPVPFSYKCSDERVKTLWHKVSCSIIIAEFQRTFQSIPFFSIDGGVVLRPSKNELLCACVGGRFILEDGGSHLPNMAGTEATARPTAIRTSASARTGGRLASGPLRRGACRAAPRTPASPSGATRQRRRRV